MITDTQSFIAAMAARGSLRFAAPVAVDAVSRQVRVETERARSERKRRAAGCRVYAQPFKGKLPARSDPGYKAAYMRLARAAGKWKGKR